jgi:serine/threonine-protein kinase
MKHRQIGRYLIKAELKRGGMSTVFLAHDPLFERDVAIKLMPQEMLDKPTLRTRFEREAKIIASLEHPAIVTVYDFGEKNGQPYLVLRFMTGGSLEDLLRLGPLTLEETAHLIKRLASALDEVHSKGIVHRDLKPSNILFDHRHDPFISDFGIVRVNLGNARLTSTGDAIGTPAYMSPEQIRGDRLLDGRSDVYALGVLLFEMLAGKHPFETLTPMGVAVKHITAPVPPILEIKPDLPAGIELILAQAMAKTPEARYQTATEMAEAVEGLLAEPIPVGAEAIAVSRSEPPTTIRLNGLAKTNGHHQAVLSSSAPLIVAEDPQPQPAPVLSKPARPKPRLAWLLVSGLFLLFLVNGGIALNGLSDESTPTAQALLLPPASPTPTITATATTPPTATATPTPLPTVTPTPSPSPSPTLTTTPEFVTVTAVDAAAYFTGPDVIYTQLETFVERGETVTALAQSENGSWLLVENGEDAQGWVARRFFGENEATEELPVSEFILAGEINTPTAAATQVIAIWSVAATAAIGNDRWQTDLLVTVPAGGTYQFQVADLAINARLQNTENGLATYRVTVSGMNCVGPLAADLTVTHNGSPLEARNASTGQVQPVFVSPPDCG